MSSLLPPPASLFNSHDLGRLTLRSYDDSFTKECIEAVVYSFLHSVLFHRALGISRICELQYLYYPFSLALHERKEGEARLLDQADEDYDDRLYVPAVEDVDLHYRVKKVVQLALETLQPEKANRIVGVGNAAIQVEIEFGITDTAHREALATKREQRRNRRCESLWRHRKRAADELHGSLNASDGGGSEEESIARRRSSGGTGGSNNSSEGAPTSVSGGLFGSLSRYAGGWWSGGRKSNESVDSTGEGGSDSDLQTSGGGGAKRGSTAIGSASSSFSTAASAAAAAASTPAMSSSFNLWSDAVFRAEQEIMHRLAFNIEPEDASERMKSGRSRSSSAGTSVHLTIEEQTLLHKALVLELKKRCKEDEELCHRIWERWRLEVVLEEREKERVSHLRSSRDVEELDMSEFIVPETSLAQKALVAQHVRQQCTQLLTTIVDKTLQFVDRLPVLTSNASAKPVCWPVGFHICRKVMHRNDEKDGENDDGDDDIDWEAVDGTKEDLKTVGKQLLSAFYRGK